MFAEIVPRFELDLLELFAISSIRSRTACRQADPPRLEMLGLVPSCDRKEMFLELLRHSLVSNLFV